VRRLLSRSADRVVAYKRQPLTDGNGRMFVLEDRGFIHDADATGEHDPFGRVSLHVDTGQRRHCRPKIAEEMEAAEEFTTEKQRWQRNTSPFSPLPLS